jgi:hypothetical protein
MKPLLVASTLLVLFSGCSLSPEVRAYNACLARHGHDAVICDGPLQAYEVDFPTFEASARPR